MASATTVNRYDFFLVYASADKAEAKALYDLLTTKHHARVFLDSASLLPGDAWADELPRALRQSDVSVVLVSSNSDAMLYQREEITTGITLFREPSGQRVVPVYLDHLASRRPDIPYELRRVQGIFLDDAGSMERIADQLVSMLQTARERAPGTGLVALRPNIIISDELDSFLGV
jgi:hypothetical protein